MIGEEIPALISSFPAGVKIEALIFLISSFDASWILSWNEISAASRPCGMAACDGSFGVCHKVGKDLKETPFNESGGSTKRFLGGSLKFGVNDSLEKRPEPQ